MSRKMREKLRSYKRAPGSFVLMLLVMFSAMMTFAVLLFLIAYILINGIPHIKSDLFALKYTSENGSLFDCIYFDQWNSAYQIGFVCTEIYK